IRVNHENGPPSVTIVLQPAHRAFGSLVWCLRNNYTFVRSNWPGARREVGSVSAAILDRLSNEAPGQFQCNPEGGMSFGRRRCCSLLTDPLRDMLCASAEARRA